MAFLNTLIQVIQILSALIVIGLVLMQHGKGADMGAAFGSGASGSVFGATGSSNFLSKATAWAAATFFATTLAMAFFLNKSYSSGSVMSNVPAITAPAKPTVPGDVPAVPSTGVPAVVSPSVVSPSAPAAPAAASKPAAPAMPAEVPKQ